MSVKYFSMAELDARIVARHVEAERDRRVRCLLDNGENPRG
jgi:hypothetical protein